MKILKAVLILTVFTIFTGNVFAQRILIGPRAAFNYNVYNNKTVTLSTNGIGVSVGGQLDILFNKNIGIMINLSPFDMRDVSNSETTSQGNASTTVDNSVSVAYATLDPMFQTNFSEFYIAAGPSIGFKLNASGERTTTQTGAQPTTQPIQLTPKSAIFGIAVGTGYNIKLSPDMKLATEFMANIPLSDFEDTPGTKNKIFTMKFGVALKFRL